jgi:hypothetical protein
MHIFMSNQKKIVSFNTDRRLLPEYWAGMRKFTKIMFVRVKDIKAT